jgi:hypothetical protein
MPTKEAKLLELMRQDRAVHLKRQSADDVITREATTEVVPAVRIARVTPKRRGAVDT